MTVSESILDLAKYAEDNTLIPSTDIYCEGWLLRLLLALAEESQSNCFPFDYGVNTTCYSEGLLYTAFERKNSLDLAESHTHADAVLGNIRIKKKDPKTKEQGTKRGIELLPNAKQFIVLEAKIFSRLSEDVSNAPGYHQVARNVACMADMLRRLARRDKLSSSEIFRTLEEVGFYVLAPEDQIAKKKHFKGTESITDLITTKEIVSRVKKRITDHPADTRPAFFDTLVKEWLEPLLNKMTCEAHSWESILDKVTEDNRAVGATVRAFYQKCLYYNAKS